MDRGGVQPGRGDSHRCRPGAASHGDAHHRSASADDWRRVLGVRQTVSPHVHVEATGHRSRSAHEDCQRLVERAGAFLALASMVDGARLNRLLRRERQLVVRGTAFHRADRHAGRRRHSARPAQCSRCLERRRAIDGTRNRHDSRSRHGQIPRPTQRPTIGHPPATARQLPSSGYTFTCPLRRDALSQMTR